MDPYPSVSISSFWMSLNQDRDAHIPSSPDLYLHRACSGQVDSKMNYQQISYHFQYFFAVFKT